MKKEDLKNVYDEIKISSSEKAKIFNNIMEKKNKKINWLPVIGFGLVALASVGLFMILSDVNTKVQILENSNVDITYFEKFDENFMERSSEDFIVYLLLIS